MGDHPPITPCRAAVPGEHSGDAARIFELVVRHFLASVSPDAVWESTRVSLVVEPANEAFSASGKVLKFGASSTFSSIATIATSRRRTITTPARICWATSGEEEVEEERALPISLPGT